MTFRLKKSKEIGLFVNSLLGCFRFFKELVCKRLKFQFGEDLLQFVLIGFGNGKLVEHEAHRCRGADGCQELRHLDIVYRVLHLFAQLTLD